MLKANRVTRYLIDLVLRRDNYATLLLGLAAPRRPPLADLLRKTTISIDEFRNSRQVFYSPDIHTALQRRTHPIPLWLNLYLLSFKVTSPQHASGPALETALAENASPDVQAPLLVLALIHLARFDLVGPMQDVVDAFLAVSSTSATNIHFNHFLAAIASVPSPQSRFFAIQLLEAMEARNIRVWARTQRPMLYDRHATLRLGPYLAQRAKRLREPPNAANMLIQLRSTRSADHASRYFERLRRVRPPRSQRSMHVHRLNKARTHLVRVQPSSRRAWFTLYRELLPHTLGSKKLHLRRPGYPRFPLGKRRVNIDDWTAAFRASSTDRYISAARVHRISRHGYAISDFQRTTEAKRHLIRAYLLRGKWAKARYHWENFARSGLPFTPEIFAVGLQVVTFAKAPQDALALLRVHGQRDPMRLNAYVKTTTQLVNVVMSSLVEILRPDLVFRLWDAMETIYGVRPTSETLRIVLQAAQLPLILDDSFAGQTALLALKIPFRQRPAPPKDPLKAIMEQAEASYTSGIWRDQLATETASQVFYDVGLGGEAKMRELLQLDIPATAIRPYAGSGRIVYSLPPPTFAPHAPSHLLSSGELVKLLTVPAPPPLLQPTHPRQTSPAYERVWAEYIQLLGMTRRAPEIARVLVWMRAFGVVPRRRTLGIALAFWNEVSIHAPMMAMIAGEGGDEYARLVRWLEAWLGGRVPTYEEVLMWHKRIEEVRRWRRDTFESGRYNVAEEERIWGRS
ncbi:hypothetical protein MKEN_01138600 [Mycena kentingensis (nom. inval.)]|nr:hypothetical protein MKEN_01138600 [Mycena kentingensis (nom. inval.)]